MNKKLFSVNAYYNDLKELFIFYETKNYHTDFIAINSYRLAHVSPRSQRKQYIR